MSGRWQAPDAGVVFRRHELAWCTRQLVVNTPGSGFPAQGCFCKEWGMQRRLQTERVRPGSDGRGERAALGPAPSSQSSQPAQGRREAF